jgi:hypothetical protein
MICVTAAGLLLAGCVHVPTGPNVMALPGSGKTFDEFNYDDAVCRDWASQRTGITRSRAANDSAVSGAAIGTVLGAATGAALGAASGHPATGAAVGAGAGLLGGSLVGASNAEEAGSIVQQRYDMAYVQCMYARGNQVPLPRGAQTAYRPPRPRRRVPPPPPGAPPPPPPDVDDSPY